MTYFQIRESIGYRELKSDLITTAITFLYPAHTNRSHDEKLADIA